MKEYCESIKWTHQFPLVRQDDAFEKMALRTSRWWQQLPYNSILYAQFYEKLSPALGYALSYAFTPFFQPANQRQIPSFLPFKRRQDAFALRVHANVLACKLETKARSKFSRFSSLWFVTAFLSDWCHFRRLKTIMCSIRVPRWRNLFRKNVEGVMLWIRTPQVKGLALIIYVPRARLNEIIKRGASSGRSDEK